MTGRVNVLCRRLTVAVAFFAAFGSAPVFAGGTGDEREKLSLKVENIAAAEIRCVAVLAHFVTRDLPPIGSGRETEFTLRRNLDDGTLSYGSFGDHPMLLENLLCGVTSDWTATVRDLALSAVRSDPKRQFFFRCGLQKGQIVCHQP